MKCAKCGSHNREGVKFCEECGAKLELECPTCKAKIPIGKKFCGECGHKLTEPQKTPSIDYSEPQSYTPKFLADKILTNRFVMEGERKVVTVIFADVANYTVLSEKLDPEEVHQIMDGCFSILMDEIHKYEGTINQFTGDGAMALFGAPVAHEDHAQRACYAALSIQRAMGTYGEKIQNDCGVDFKMRMGLNSGPVIVGSIGDDLRMDYTAMGDTTNLAARMESLAKPGTILISANTYKLSRDFFEFTALGDLKVKGKEEAQGAYELIRATEVETRIEAAAAKGLTTFIGRSRELQAIKEAYDKVRSGSGQVVGIVGEAGVGKSRLLLELRKELPTGAYTYLEGRCLHYGGNLVYLPIVDILRSYLAVEEVDREFVIKKKLQGKLLQLDDQFKVHIPPFQELLSLKVDDEKYTQLDPGQKKTRTFEAIRDLLVRESQNKSLLLAVEDLHWIDKTSEEFLSYLIEWLAHSHILLILLYRPEHTHQWGSKSYYNKVGVDQLSTKNSAELVKVILEGGKVVPELRDMILGRAGGNPLYVEELTHSLLENGTIQKKDHQYVLSRDPSSIQVPDTIQGIITARIDRVEESLKRIMQVASVIGREFAFRILQTTMGMHEELKSQLLNLQGLEFISEKRLFPELEYIFKHALTQEVAYNSLLQKRRRLIHAKIGSAIEALYTNRIEEYYELLAYHYSRSDNKEKMWQYLDLANKKAAKLNANEDAKIYFDQAIQLLDKLPDTEENRKRRISLIVNNYDVFELLFKYEDYYKILKRFEQTVFNLNSLDLLGKLHTRLGLCEMIFSKFDQAIQTSTKALEFCDAAGNVEYASYAYVTLQWCYLWKAEFSQALTQSENALRLLNQQFDLRWFMWAIAGASYAYRYLGCWNEAISEAQNGLKTGEEYSDNGLISGCASALAHAYVAKLDLPRAIEYGKYAIDKAPTPMDEAVAQVTLAIAWCRSGELDKGIQILTSVIPNFEAADFIPMVVIFKTYLGEGYWLDGTYDKAKQTIEESVKLAMRFGMRFFVAFSHRILGEIARIKNPDESFAHFEKSILTLKEIKAENELALAYAGYGRLFKQIGNDDGAREYLNKALEILEQLGTLIEPEKVREELAELPSA
jgi:class 3 adenylate cyclase/tetratricopeptide (TPR) repeat protein